MRLPCQMKPDHIIKNIYGQILESHNWRKKIFWQFIRSCCILSAFDLSVRCKLMKSWLLHLLLSFLLLLFVLLFSVGRMSSPTFPFGNGSGSRYLGRVSGGRECGRWGIQRDIRRCGGTDGRLFLSALKKNKQKKQPSAEAAGNFFF